MRALPILLVIALAAGGPSPVLAAATTAPKPAVARPAKPAVKPKAAAGRPATQTRTLDAVHIEGELDVPEVLFITARDQRRIVGFQHRRYLPGSAEVARSTPLPSHVVVGRRPAPASEEKPK